MSLAQFCGRMPRAATASRLRHRLRTLRRRQQAAHAAADPSSAEVLPTNDVVEASVRTLLGSHRSARSLLAVSKSIASACLISLAPPSKRWDPMAVTAQPFVFGDALGVSVFTSRHYLSAFCERFNYSVYGPDNALWAAGTPSPRHIGTAAAVAPLPDRLQYECAEAVPLGPEAGDRRLRGFFADMGTILEGVNVLSSSVDIALNPGSELELVLARRKADTLVSCDRMLLDAWNATAREVAAEFAGFFAAKCPEVASARYCTLPQLQPSGTPVAQIECDMVIAVCSANWRMTVQKAAWEKAKGLLDGLPTLRLIELRDAPAHVVDSATCFYEAGSTSSVKWQAIGATHVTDVDVPGYVCYGEAHTVGLRP